MREAERTCDPVWGDRVLVTVRSAVSECDRDGRVGDVVRLGEAPEALLERSFVFETVKLAVPRDCVNDLVRSVDAERVPRESLFVSVTVVLRVRRWVRVRRE